MRGVGFNEGYISIGEIGEFTREIICDWDRHYIGTELKQFLLST
jgi:hypothetical protein